MNLGGTCLMILMICNEEMCQEFILPEYRSSEYDISIADSHFSEKLAIHLQSEENGWWLLSSDAYEISVDGEPSERVHLRDDRKITVSDKASNWYRILVVESSEKTCTMRKYSLTHCTDITIGKSQECTIQYDFRNFISGLHARLVCRSDGWYLEDRSLNGVFMDSGRIRGRRKLGFGDHIIIFGLHLVYLRDILALCSHYGELRVEEEVLCPYEEEALSGAEVPEYAALHRKPYEEGRAECFNRVPRNVPFLYSGEVEIEAPPMPKEIKQKPWFLTVGPSLTMAVPMLLGCLFMIWGSYQRGYGAGAYMFAGLVAALGSAVLGTFWAVKSLNFSKEEVLREERERFSAYSSYLLQITEKLKEKYEYNADTMKKMYPSASYCASIDRTSPLLWNRNHTHEDFLYHRLGLGEVPFQVSITVPKDKFALKEDALSKKPAQICQRFKTLYHVPVGISLKDKRLIGLAGGNERMGALDIMYSVIADIAATHCYTDVKFVFLYDREDLDRGMENAWECMKWFPHVWSEDRRMRYMGSTDTERRDVMFELSNIMRSRKQGLDQREKNGMPKPYYLIFVSSPQLLEGELLAKYVYESAPECGMTAFLMAESVEQLPNACVDIVQWDRNFCGYYNLLAGAMEKQQISLDRITAFEIERMGKRIADVRVNETETTNEIPVFLDFFSMYGVRRPEEFDAPSRWRKNRTYNSMKALIGKRSGNIDCYLDVHEKYHGPHGLVAGTAGSGKSEMLQTYILSLALNFSPEDVAFFLIDFKEGGMASLFEGLPHIAGSISNLSGNQIQRAMVSIKSENVRRQKIFTQYGINNINLYARMYKKKEVKEAIPHLFVIIDEFAELEKEEPDFLRELISVAQAGRSLGIHLILATQKPSGIVSDNIRSNSRFRLCLRVQDRQDSNDMLHRPDAAFITCAGRGYLQVGNGEIFEQFQSGYSGAPYEYDAGEDAADVTLLTLTGRVALAAGRPRTVKKEQADSAEERPEITQLQAVVGYLKKTALDMGGMRARQLWMPVLPTEIPGTSTTRRWERH